MSTQRQMESLAACRWAENSTIPARPSSAAVFEQSLFKGNQRTLRKIYDNWRIRSTLESRVANESVSKSATCFFIDNFTLPARTISGLYKCRRRAQGAAIAPPADYVHQQGRVLTTFRNALRKLFHARNLEGAVVDTVMHGGGTDTNAAICGALPGAVPPCGRTGACRPPSSGLLLAGGCVGVDKALDLVRRTGPALLLRIRSGRPNRPS